MRFRILWSDLAASIWFRPLLWVLAMAALALFLITVDRSLSARGIHVELPYLLLSEVEGARTLLGAIAAALLTVTTLTFSIIMLAVVQTANAYSPRILDAYFSDPINQHVLGIFTGTFLYSLFVLREVRSIDGIGYVPPIAVAGVLISIFVATVAFLFFIGHVAHSIKVSDVIKRIQAETREAMAVIFPEDMGQPCAEEQAPEVPEGAAGMILATRDGYVAAIASSELLSVATRTGVVLRLEVMVGDSVLRGTPLASVWPRAKAETLAEYVRDAVAVRDERTLVQDAHYGAQQLSDMALRALSTSINDPTTAVNCIDGLATLSVELVQHPPVSPYRCDADGNLRVIAQGQSFASLLDVAFNQIRHYAASDPVVTLHLLTVFRQIGYSASRPSDRVALWEHVCRLAWSANMGILAPTDREAVNRHLCAAAAVLGQDPTLLLLRVEPRAV